DTRGHASREGSQSVFWDHPALVIDWRPDDHEGAAHETVSRVHGGQLLPEQCRYDELPGPFVQHSSANVARLDLLGRVYPFEADRHRLVSVRRVHSDGTL